MGTTLRQLLVSAGGMLDGIPLKFFTPGGSSTPIFTPAQLDVPLSFDDVAAAGSMLGTTALMCFNETVSVPWAVWKWLEFYKHESCGKCTPCREGTGWLVQILRRVVSGAGTLEDLDTMADAASNIAGRSFCALGDAAATPILSSFKYFRSDFEDLVTGRTPPVVEIEIACGGALMTQVATPPPADRAGAGTGSGGPRPADHRRRQRHRAQGRAGDPGRRTDRHRHPAVLRPPAAGAGRRLPAVPGRGRDGRPADAQAAGRPAPRPSPTAWWSGPSSARRSRRRRSGPTWNSCC